MKVLVMWPPHVPSYFNAGHHSITFLTSNYLRTLPEVAEVQAIDAGALNYNWKEISDLLYQGEFDTIVLINDFDNTDGFDRVIRYARTLSPGSRIITGGRLSSQAPRTFHEFDLDAIVVSGDVEAGVADYLRWLRSGSNSSLRGVSVKNVDGWTSTVPGVYLPADEWCLPDVTEIPYAAYDCMYGQDQNKFCGIPKRRELVVPAARGCPIGCSFCEVPSYQGLRDRRLTVERTIDYIETSFAEHAFEYVAFYAPTFTLDRKWTAELCRTFIDRGSRYPWKCATTISHLPPDLMALMGKSGCVRVSVGLETLEANGRSELPCQKQIELDRFHQLADQCGELGIELNCFVILGLPGTTVAGTRRTIDEIRAAAGRVRPTMYSSIEDLRESTTAAEAARFNRQLLPQGGGEFYQFLFSREDRLTNVMEQIPVRRGEAS